MSVLAAHQPQYLPWLGWFDKLDRADVFVLLDNVQFKKNEWQNRNRIKTADGWQWLTVPVRHRFGQTIGEVEISGGGSWARKHLRALQSSYGRAPHFDAVMPRLTAVLERDWGRLAPLNIELIERLAGLLGIDTRTVLSSRVPARDHPTLRLVDLCRELGADVYLSGAGGRDYLDLVAFEEAGIEVRWQCFEHPEYRQLFGEFEPDLSVVDLLMNRGPESLEILRSGRL